MHCPPIRVLVCAILTLLSITVTVAIDTVQTPGLSPKDPVCCSQTGAKICVQLVDREQNKCDGTLIGNKTAVLDSFKCHTPEGDQKAVSEKYDCRMPEPILDKYKCEQSADSKLPSSQTKTGGESPTGREGWSALFPMLHAYAATENEPKNTSELIKSDKGHDGDVEEPTNKDNATHMSSLARTAHLFKPVVTHKDTVDNHSLSHERPLFGARVIHVHTQVLRHEVIIRQEPSAEAVAREEKQHLWGVVVIVVLVRFTPKMAISTAQIVFAQLI